MVLEHPEDIIRDLRPAITDSPERYTAIQRAREGIGYDRTLGHFVHSLMAAHT